MNMLGKGLLEVDTQQTEIRSPWHLSRHLAVDCKRMNELNQDGSALTQICQRTHYPSTNYHTVVMSSMAIVLKQHIGFTLSMNYMMSKMF